MHESVKFLSTISAIVGDAAEKAERAALEAKRIGLDGRLLHACFLIDVVHLSMSRIEPTHECAHVTQLHSLKKPYESPDMQAP